MVKCVMHMFIFCLFDPEWGLSTDDRLTMWHVGGGASTPEVSC